MESSLGGLIGNLHRFHLAYAALRLGLPRALAEDPKSCPVLAAELKLAEARLARLLRGLVWAEILAVDEAARYRLTPAGRELLDEEPTAVAASILFQGRFLAAGWGRLEEWVRDGAVPYRAAHGVDFFAALVGDPDLAAAFVRPMATRTREYSSAIAQLPELEGPKRILDVGGGDGRLVLDLLKLRPELSGATFDLAALADAGRVAIARDGLASRCAFIAGDMFSAVPPAYDAYLLKWILHDWNDEDAVRILRSVRQAMAPHSVVLVIERLFPSDFREDRRLIPADLNMLVLNGGAERTTEQYQELLRAAGLKLGAVKPIPSQYGFSVMVGRAWPTAAPP